MACLAQQSSDILILGIEDASDNAAEILVGLHLRQNDAAVTDKPRQRFVRGLRGTSLLPAAARPLGRVQTRDTNLRPDLVTRPHGDARLDRIAIHNAQNLGGERTGLRHAAHRHRGRDLGTLHPLTDKGSRSNSGSESKQRDRSRISHPSLIAFHARYGKTVSL